MTTVYTPVERPRLFHTNEDVKKHLITVGRAIEQDAEMVNVDPSIVSGITIHTEIKPDAKVTTIQYSIDRIADPRLGKRCPHCGGRIEKRDSEWYCHSCHFWWEEKNEQ